jgi:hypothetical protein
MGSDAAQKLPSMIMTARRVSLAGENVRHDWRGGVGIDVMGLAGEDGESPARRARRGLLGRVVGNGGLFAPVITKAGMVMAASSPAAARPLPGRR